MTTKLEKFWKFFRNDIGELVHKPSSATETGAEVSKTSLELAIALGLLGSPFAPVAVAGLSFVGLASKGIKFYQDRTKDKLTLEECVTIASRLAYVETLPQKKSRQLHEQNIELGQRQVDIYAGLNVMILLLELHRYAQERDDLKKQIIFYPSGQLQEQNNRASKLRQIINYTDVIGSFNTLVGKYLKGANLGSINLSGLNLRSTNLSGANLKGVYLNGGDLSDTNLSGANLSRAKLRGVYLSDAKLINANISGGDLRGSNLSCTQLRSANLRSTNLRGIYLSGANLSGADLRCADLSHAYLSGAHLNGTNLSGAYLNGANLSGVDFSGAYLSDEFVGNIRWDQNTNWEGVRGLETAKNLPEALKQQLGLDITPKEDEN